MAQNKLGKIGWAKNRNKIESAYRNLVEKKAGSVDRFYKVITDFARSKLTKALFDSAEGVSTVDDRSQDVAIYVWSKLGEFKGSVGSFYPWLNRICYTQGAAAVNESREQATNRVDLFVEVEDGSGDFEENPDLYPTDMPPQYQRELPEFIQGTDLKICMYIRADKTYSQIADLLEISEDAVEVRIRRMRKKIEEMKNA